MKDIEKKVLKVLIIGDSGIGKSSLLNRYIKNEFKEDIKTTIGVEFEKTDITINGENYTLQIWDPGGEKRFQEFLRNYIKGATGIAILFDKTNFNSFINIEKWINFVHSNELHVPLLLVATKCDLEEFSLVADVLAKKTQERFNMIDYIKSSAKTGLNVNNVFKLLTEYIIKNK